MTARPKPPTRCGSHRRPWQACLELLACGAHLTRCEAAKTETDTAGQPPVHGEADENAVEYGWVAHGRTRSAGIQTPGHSARWLASRAVAMAQRTTNMTLMPGAQQPDPNAHIVHRNVHTRRSAWTRDTDPPPPELPSAAGSDGRQND